MSWRKVPVLRRFGVTVSYVRAKMERRERVLTTLAPALIRLSDETGRGPAVDCTHAAHLCTDSRAVRHTSGAA